MTENRTEIMAEKLTQISGMQVIKEVVGREGQRPEKIIIK